MVDQVLLILDKNGQLHEISGFLFCGSKSIH